MKIIKHILSEIKCYLRRVFNSGSHQRLSHGKKVFPDLLLMPVRQIQALGKILFKSALSFGFCVFSYAFILKSHNYSAIEVNSLPSEYINVNIFDFETKISYCLYYSCCELRKFPKDDIIDFLVPDT